MSDTPRTDAALQSTGDARGSGTSAIYVFASFTRELEREANSHKDQRDNAIREMDRAHLENNELRRFKAAALTLTTEASVLHVMEQEVEALWKSQKGVDPTTGKMWLTPRMERDSVKIQEMWAAQDKAMSKEKT